MTKNTQVFRSLKTYFSNRTVICYARICYLSQPILCPNRKSSSNIRNILKSMPKNRERETLRHVKYRKTFGGNLPPSSKIDVQVIGSGGRGTPKAVMLLTDHTRYLFNCGEGTQRIAGEHRIKLAKMENLFVTSKTWNNVGGLLGIAFTQQSIGVPQLTIHGPPGVEKIVKMAKGFSVEKTDIQICKRELHEGVFEDHCFKIEYVPVCKHSGDEELLLKPGTDESEKTKEDISTDTEQNCRNFTSDIQKERADCDSDSSSSLMKNTDKNNDITDRVRTQNNEETLQSKCDEGSDTQRTVRGKQYESNEQNLIVELHDSVKYPGNKDGVEVTVAYICTAFAAQRKVIMEKCAELDVPAGPILRILKNEESVTLDDGRVIHPDQVLSPYEEPGAVIVLECSDEEYMDKLVTKEEFFQEQNGTNRKVDLVIHMTPLSIVENAKYKAFIERFGESTKHLILNESCSEIAFEGIYRIQAKLNLLHPSIFPLLPHQIDPEKIDVAKDAKYVTGAPNLIYQHRGNARGFTSSECIALNNQSYIDEIMKGDGVAGKLDELKETFQDFEQHERKLYPEIVFLGTGSAVPSKERNVSATLLHLDEDSSLLIDCGEGSDGQLYRHYGEKTDEVLVKIKAICVTHLHADHHLGLFGILEARLKAYKKFGIPFTPVYLVAPIQISRWLAFYGRQMKSVHDQLRLAPSQRMLPYLTAERYAAEYKELLKNCGLQELIPVAVEHCWNAYGFVFEHEDGWKIVFSGDTMPCNRLVVAGENCDVLIHEATMEDDLIEDAKFKSHSTVSQAIEIGKKMCAKFTLLNHFSQRYAKIPVIDDKLVDNVGISFDNMRISLSEVSVLPKLIDPMKLIFAEYYEELEKSLQKRNLKRERERKIKLGAEDDRKPHTSKKQKQNKDSNLSEGDSKFNREDKNDSCENNSKDNNKSEIDQKL